MCGEALEQFGHGSFGAVPAIYKRRNDRDAQVMQLAGLAQEGWAGKTDGMRTWVDCTTRKTEWSSRVEETFQFETARKRKGEKDFRF